MAGDGGRTASDSGRMAGDSGRMAGDSGRTAGERAGGGKSSATSATSTPATSAPAAATPATSAPAAATPAASAPAAAALAASGPAAAAPAARSAAVPEGPVVRRTAAGWSVGDEDMPDLTCAMVLADLIAAELPDPVPEPPGRSGATTATATATGSDHGGGAAGGRLAADGPGGSAAAGAGEAARNHAAGNDGSPDETRRLRATVGQLERALAVRIRVEQAIGILAERHRIRPRQAFEQLRSVARGRGQRVIDIAGDVVASATNPLLPLPEELSRPSLAPRQRARSQRRTRDVS